MAYPDLQDRSRLEALYRACGSWRAVARRLGCSEGTVFAAAKRLGISTGPGPLSDEDLLRYLRERRTLTEIADALSLPPKGALERIESLRQSGYRIVESGGHYWLDTAPVAAEAPIDANPGRRDRLRIAIVSDTHLCSKAQQLSHLHDFYRRIADMGITDVYHAGDLIDGEGLYRGHEHEVFVHGMDDQVAYAVEHYPRIEGVTTHLIGGNHDLVYVRRAGADPLIRVAAVRPDIAYLGPYAAWLELSPKCTLYLLHPDGGPSYSRSYRLQKVIEAFEGGRKPNIAVLGHWHLQCYVFVRNVHGFLGMCFQSQTSYERRKALQPNVGGMILDIALDDDGRIHHLRHETINYLLPKEKDWAA